MAGRQKRSRKDYLKASGIAGFLVGSEVANYSLWSYYTSRTGEVAERIVKDLEVYQKINPNAPPIEYSLSSSEKEILKKNLEEFLKGEIPNPLDIFSLDPISLLFKVMKYSSAVVLFYKILKKSSGSGTARVHGSSRFERIKRFFKKMIKYGPWLSLLIGEFGEGFLIYERGQTILNYEHKGPIYIVSPNPNEIPKKSEEELKEDIKRHLNKRSLIKQGLNYIINLLGGFFSGIYSTLASNTSTLILSAVTLGAISGIFYYLRRLYKRRRLI